MKVLPKVFTAEASPFAAYGIPFFIFLSVGFCWYSWWYIPLIRTTGTITQEILQLKEEKSSLEKRIGRFRSLVKKVHELRDYVQEVSSQLTVSVSDLFAQMLTLIEQLGLTKNSSVLSKRELLCSFIIYTYKITFSGSFEDILRFLKKLYERRPVLLCRNCELKKVNNELVCFLEINLLEKRHS